MQNVFNTTNLTVIILALVSYLGVDALIDEATAQQLAQGIILLVTAVIAIYQNIGKMQALSERDAARVMAEDYKNSYLKAIK